MLPLEYAKAPKSTWEDRATKLLTQVGITGDKVYRMPGKLSGGEQQRVSIARALANQPKLVLADEPTGNLDSKSGLQVMRIFQRLSEEGKTIILVTHETFTAEHAKRILRMVDGRIVSDEPVTNRRFADQENTLLK